MSEYQDFTCYPMSRHRKPAKTPPSALAWQIAKIFTPIYAVIIFTESALFKSALALVFFYLNRH